MLKSTDVVNAGCSARFIVLETTIHPVGDGSIYLLIPKVDRVYLEGQFTLKTNLRIGENLNPCLSSREA